MKLSLSTHALIEPSANYLYQVVQGTDQVTTYFGEVLPLWAYFVLTRGRMVETFRPIVRLLDGLVVKLKFC